MDGRGRAYDNIFVERLWRSVKHEDIYLNGYAPMGEPSLGKALSQRVLWRHVNEVVLHQGAGLHFRNAVSGEVALTGIQAL